MKKNIEKIIKIFIYLTFFVPLVVVPSSFIFPFIVPKILLFRSLIAVSLLGFFLLLIINWQEYKPKFTWLSISLLSFLVSFAISTFIGVDPYHSFWDNHERMLGLFTIIHYIVYYLICSKVFKNWEEWKWALKVFLGAGTLVMFIGILQIFKPDLLLNGGSDRVASTLGNSVYVGGYGLFLSFVAYLLFIKEKIKSFKYIIALCGIMALVGVIFSGSRGAILGFFGGVTFAALLYSFTLKEFPRVRKGIWVVAIIGILGLGILFVFRESAFVTRIPAIGRLLNTSVSDVTQSARFLAWEAAVKGWKQKPFFGWGPNNFFYTFNENYDPRSLNFGYGETWFDNAHNILLNTLAVQGVFGLIAYLSIFIFALCVIYKAYRKGYLDQHIAIIMAAFLIAHLVQNITVFENPTSYLYFMFWLAFINKLTERENSQISNQNKDDENVKKIFTPDKKIGYGIIVGSIVIAGIFIFITNIQPARANKKTLNTLRQLNANLGVDNVVEEVKSTLSFSSPHIDDIRGDIAKGLNNVIYNSQNQFSEQNKDQFNKIFSLAEEAIKPNFILHPLDIRNYMLLAQLYQTRAVIYKDVISLQQSEEYLAKALELSPSRQQVLFALANTKLQLRKDAEALKIFEDTLALNDNIGEAYWRLAYAYALINKFDKAKQTLDLATKRNIRFNDQEKQIIAEISTQLQALATSTTSTP